MPSNRDEVIACRPSDFEKYVAGMDDVNAVDERGQTLLLHAVANNDLMKVRFLIKAGADIDHQDEASAQTPLMGAVQERNLGVFKLLLKSGADLYLSGMNGDDVLYHLHQMEESEFKSEVIRLTDDCEKRFKNIGVEYITGDVVRQRLAECVPVCLSRFRSYITETLPEQVIYDAKTDSETTYRRITEDDLLREVFQGGKLREHVSLYVHGIEKAHTVLRADLSDTFMNTTDVQYRNKLQLPNVPFSHDLPMPPSDWIVSHAGVTGAKAEGDIDWIASLRKNSKFSLSRLV